MRLVRRLKDELKVNTTCGASNVSFGLPNRDGINGAFLTMAIAAGLTSAITNPLARGHHPLVHGGGRHDGSRPGLRALDPQVPRRHRLRAPPRRETRLRARPRAGAAKAVTAVDRSRRPERGFVSRPDPLVVFTPSGKRGRFAVGTPLLAAARTLGVDIDSVCGGRAICGRCQVLVAEGEFAKHGVRSAADSLSPLSESEQRYSSRQPLAAGRRLSCQARVEADVVIDVPPGSQVHRQVVRKSAEARDIELYPLVKLHYVEVTEPDMHDPSGDLQRLEAALAREWQLADLQCDLTVLQQLQAVLRAGGWKVTVAVHDASRIIAVWPGFHDESFGLALDVGSTTIAAHLCDLASGEVVASAGRMNPQIRFGEDLMSRVSYAMMNPGGAAQMTAAVRQAIERARGGSQCERRHRAAGDSRSDTGRQSDHASPGARHRSGRARRRTIRARRRSRPSP